MYKIFIVFIEQEFYGLKSRVEFRGSRVEFGVRLSLELRSSFGVVLRLGLGLSSGVWLLLYVCIYERMVLLRTFSSRR